MVAHRPPSLRIREWLTLLVIVAVCPAGFLLVHATSVERAALVDDVSQDLERAVAEAAENVTAEVERADGALSVLADSSAVQAHDGPRCSREARLIRQRFGFANVGAAGAGDARIFCSAEPSSGLVSIVDRVYFQRALRSRGAVAGNAVLARVVAKPVLHVARAYFDARSRPRGVVYAALGVERLSALARSVPARHGETLRLLDSRGQDVLSDFGRLALGGRDDGVPSIPEREGEICSNAPLWIGGEDSGLIVSACVTRADALAPITSVVRGSIALYLAVAALSLVAAWVLGEFVIVRRLRRVLGAAERLANGDLRARSRLHGRDEVGRLGTVFDRMAEALDALTLQNRLILDSVGTGILGVGSRGTITFANPSAVRMLASDASVLVGADVRHVLEPSGDVLAGGGVSRALDATLSGGAASSLDGAWLQRPDGSRFAANLKVAALRHDDEVIGTVVTVEDVSEQRRLEAAVRHSQKIDAVGRLAAGVAHDFNNLLSVILSAGHHLVEQLPQGDPLRDEADEIVSASSHAAALTRQLLSFSRKQVPRPSVLDPGAVILGLRKLLGRVLGETIAIELRLDARWPVRIDPGQLEQVLVNLAVNARDAMVAGGTLCVETRDVVLEGERAARLGAAAGPHVSLAVEDDGVGMEPAVLARIFEPFFTTKEVGKGTGLGLSTVMEIVKENAGAVHVESTPGAGARFEIYLPAASGDASTAAPGSPVQPVRRSGRVLLVEDDARVRSLASRILRTAGYDVIEVDRSEDAPRIAAAAGELHALVTDMVMPGLAGPEVARRVLAARPQVRVLFVSGYPGTALDGDAALAAGAEFLQKPFTPNALLEAVDRTLLGAAVASSPRFSGDGPGVTRSRLGEAAGS